MYKRLFNINANSGIQSSSNDNGTQPNSEKSLKQNFFACTSKKLDPTQDKFMKKSKQIDDAEKKKNNLLIKQSSINKEIKLLKKKIAKEREESRPDIGQLVSNMDRITEELFVIKYDPELTSETLRLPEPPDPDSNGNELYPEVGEVFFVLAEGKQQQDVEAYKSQLEVLTSLGYMDPSPLPEDLREDLMRKYKPGSYGNVAQLEDETIKLRDRLIGVAQAHGPHGRLMKGIAASGTNPEDVIEYRAYLKKLSEFRSSKDYHEYSAIGRDLKALEDKKPYPDFLHDGDRYNCDFDSENYLLGGEK